MRSTRRTEAAGAAVALLLLAGGCLLAALLWPPAPDRPRYEGAGAQAPRRGGTFVFYHSTGVRSLDPQVAYDELSFMAIRLLFDGLLDYDEQGDISPSLARRMPEVSEDGRTFTFQLREGVRFHNGRELTAEDVAWTMHRLLDPDTGSPGASFYLAIEGAEAFRKGARDQVSGIQVVDRYTIRFRLTEPDQTFLNLMAMPFTYPVPKEHVERAGSKVQVQPVGTGPFVLEDWERGVKLLFRRFDGYWQPGRPYADRMIYYENTKPHVAAMRFRNGDIDALHGFTPAEYLFFKHADAWAPYREEQPKITIVGIAMNCEMPPFDDVHFRRAIAFAIDRQSWSRARQGRLLPAGQVVPPQLKGHDPELPHRQYFDLDRARAELREAGYPDGYPEELVVMMGEGDASRFYGEMLQSDLAKIGIRLRIRQVSFPVYLEQTGKRRTVPMFSSGWNLDFPDASNFLDPLFHSRSIHDEHSENRSFYSNPELDRLLDEARAERDRRKRVAMYRRANDIVARDAPWAFTYYPLQLEVWQPYVRGYRPHPIWDKEYRNVWLDLPRRRVARRYLGRPGLGALAALFPLGGTR